MSWHDLGLNACASPGVQAQVCKPKCEVTSSCIIHVCSVSSRHCKLLLDAYSGACEVRGSDRAGSPSSPAEGQGGSSAPPQAGFNCPAAAPATAQVSQLPPKGPPDPHWTYPPQRSGQLPHLHMLCQIGSWAAALPLW